MGWYVASGGRFLTVWVEAIQLESAKSVAAYPQKQRNPNTTILPPAAVAPRTPIAHFAKTNNPVPRGQTPNNPRSVRKQGLSLRDHRVWIVIVTATVAAAPLESSQPKTTPSG
jgi:hypothetical protein